MIYTLDDASWIEQGFLPPEMTWDFEKLWSLHPEEFGQVRYFDKTVKTPRWQQSYCKPYYFSGMMHDALPLPEEFKPFLDWAKIHSSQLNQVVANWYLNGHHYISKHSDCESQLVARAHILAISLGQTRTFRVRRKVDNEVVVDIELPDRSYIIMGGAMQERYFHEITKVSGKKGENIGRRISLTFREFK